MKIRAKQRYAALFVIAFNWTIWSGCFSNSSNTPDTPAETIAEASRRLESAGWRFDKDETNAMTRIVSYKFASPPDQLTLDCGLIADDPHDKRAGLIDFTVEGAPHSDPTAGVTDCMRGLVSIVPDAREAALRALDAMEIKGANGDGVKRAVGVATTESGWRIEIIRYMTYIPGQETVLHYRVHANSP